MTTYNSSLNNTNLLLNTYTSTLTNQSQINFKVADGSKGSETNTVVNQSIGKINYSGYSSGYVNIAEIESVTSSSAITGGILKFKTKPDASTLTDRLIIGQDGAISIESNQLNLKTSSTNNYLKYVNTTVDSVVLSGPILVGDTNVGLGTSNGNIGLYIDNSRNTNLQGNLNVGISTSETRINLSGAGDDTGYDTTVIASRTVATNDSELYLFHGSDVTDRIRYESGYHTFQIYSSTKSYTPGSEGTNVFAIENSKNVRIFGDAAPNTQNLLFNKSNDNSGIAYSQDTIGVFTQDGLFVYGDTTLSLGTTFGSTQIGLQIDPNTNVTVNQHLNIGGGGYTHNRINFNLSGDDSGSDKFVISGRYVSGNDSELFLFHGDDVTDRIRLESGLFKFQTYTSTKTYDPSTEGTTRLTINNDGQVDINTGPLTIGTTNVFTLTPSTGTISHTGAISISPTNNLNININTGKSFNVNTDKLYVDGTTGNVGINTSTVPTYNLTVNGSISATDLYGTIQTAAQPNITSLGELTKLTMNGVITSKTGTDLRLQSIIGQNVRIQNNLTEVILEVQNDTDRVGILLTSTDVKDNLSIRSNFAIRGTKNVSVNSVNVIPTTQTNPDTKGTYGYRFTVGADNIVVTHLAYFSPNVGNTTPPSIGIWKTDGTLIISTTGRDTGIVDDVNPIYYTEITPTILNANTDYVVGALSRDDEPVRFDTDGTLSSGITFVEGRKVENSIFEYPNVSTTTSMYVGGAFKFFINKSTENTGEYFKVNDGFITTNSNSINFSGTGDISSGIYDINQNNRIGYFKGTTGVVVSDGMVLYGDTTLILGTTTGGTQNNIYIDNNSVNVLNETYFTTKTYNLLSGVAIGTNIVNILSGSGSGDRTLNLLAGLTTGGNLTANIGTGSSSPAIISIGNSVLAASMTLKVGTGNFSLDGVTNSTYTIGASTTTGTITIGGTAQTGNITLGSSSGTNSVLIANGSGTNTVSIANTSTTNNNTINMLTSATAGTQAINLATGVYTTGSQTYSLFTGASSGGTQTVNIMTGTATGATQTINLATGASARTVTIGNTTGATAVNINAGTGLINSTALYSTLNSSAGGSSNQIITSGTSFSNITFGAGFVLNSIFARNILNASGATTLNTECQDIFIFGRSNMTNLSGNMLRVMAIGSDLLTTLGVAGAPSSLGARNIVAIGSNCGTTMTSARDTVLIGRNVANTITTGTDNVFIGTGSGNNLTTSSSNCVMIGSGASASASGIGSNRIAIGAQASVGADNTCVFGAVSNTTPMLVAIGSTTANALLQIGNTTTTLTGTGDRLTVYDNSATLLLQITNTPTVNMLTAANTTGTQTYNLFTGASSGGTQTVNIMTAIATGATQTINLATGASARTVNIGNTTGATAVNITAGTGSTNINNSRLNLNFNTSDVIIGPSAGNNSITGTNLVVIGSGAGTAITTGSNNIILGTNAGSSTTTLSSISLYGVNNFNKLTVRSNTTLELISIGNNNFNTTNGDGSQTGGLDPYQNVILLGNNIGVSQPSGSAGVGPNYTLSIFMGHVILNKYNSVSANINIRNLIIGSQTLQTYGTAATATKTIADNLLLGHGILNSYDSNTSDLTNNVVLGPSAALSVNTTFTSNTIIGQNAANVNRSFVSCTIVGQTAGASATGTLTSCTLIGQNAQATGALTNAIAIGAGATVKGSNSMLLGSLVAGTPVLVGISQDTPTALLHIGSSTQTATTTRLLITDSANNTLVNVDGTATTGTITIGGSSQTGNITLGSSSGTNSVLIGNGAGAGTISIANATTANATINLATAAITTATNAFNLFTGAQTGAGTLTANIMTAINTAGTQTYNLLTGANSGGTQVVNIMTNNAATGTHTVNIGNTNTQVNITGSSSSVTVVGRVRLQGTSGTDNLNIPTTGGVTITPTSGQDFTLTTAGAGNISLTTGTNFTLNGATSSVYSIGAATTTGTITIGGTAQTGNITLGSSSGTNSILIGNGAGAGTVSIANTTILGSTINIGSGALTTAVTNTFNLFTVSNITTGGTQNVNILTGASSVGSHTMNILNGSASGATQTFNLMASNTGGTLSVNIGTASVANTITIGNITGASAVNINSGTGNTKLTTTSTGIIEAYATPSSNIGSGYVKIQGPSYSDAAQTTLRAQLMLYPNTAGLVGNSYPSQSTAIDMFATFATISDQTPRRYATIKTSGGGSWGAEFLGFRVGVSNPTQSLNNDSVGEPIERMRISGRGYVSIGSTVSDSLLRIGSDNMANASSTDRLRLYNNSTVLMMQITNSTYNFGQQTNGTRITDASTSVTLNGASIIVQYKSSAGVTTSVESNTFTVTNSYVTTASVIIMSMQWLTVPSGTIMPYVLAVNNGNFTFKFFVATGNVNTNDTIYFHCLVC